MAEMEMEFKVVIIPHLEIRGSEGKIEKQILQWEKDIQIAVRRGLMVDSVEVTFVK